MHFHFPIIIIDEDFRSENASGLGIRALAEAIEAEGFEVLGVTSYGDLTSFAQQQSRASGFILSIDDEEFQPGVADKTIADLRKIRELAAASREPQIVSLADRIILDVSRMAVELDELRRQKAGASKKS